MRTGCNVQRPTFAANRKANRQFFTFLACRQWGALCTFDVLRGRDSGLFGAALFAFYLYLDCSSQLDIHIVYSARLYSPSHAVNPCFLLLRSWRLRIFLVSSDVSIVRHRTRSSSSRTLETSFKRNGRFIWWWRSSPSKSSCYLI